MGCHNIASCEVSEESPPSPWTTTAHCNSCIKACVLCELFNFSMWLLFKYGFHALCWACKFQGMLGYRTRAAKGATLWKKTTNIMHMETRHWPGRHSAFGTQKWNWKDNGNVAHQTLNVKEQQSAWKTKTIYTSTMVLFPLAATKGYKLALHLFYLFLSLWWSRKVKR